jgi:hypothetical protein
MMIHRNEDFLPWHRWFIYQFEKELRNSGVAGASNIALPYWDWTSQYYTTAPTDREKNSPLWASDFMGAFIDKSPWTITRNNWNSEDFNLGSITDVNDKLLEIPYSVFLNSLEQSNTHDNVHIWVGGTMADMTSPDDPVFYLHHAMVDKIWQEWHNLGRTTTFEEGNVIEGAFPSGIPSITPDKLIDSRSNSLKVWYAENGRVVLDNYTVSGTENYKYTGKIEAGNRTNTAKNLNGTIVNYVTGPFDVPSSTTCNMISAREVVLLPGFSAKSGSNFHAYIDATSFNTAKIDFENVSRKAEKNTIEIESFTEKDLYVFPNPSSGKFSIMLRSNDKVAYEYKILDIHGKIVLSSLNESADKLFEVDMSNHPSGLYIIQLTINGKIYLKKVIIN